ncbi:hypothetical protein LguiA_027552 [Lonicera macranthoides]
MSRSRRIESGDGGNTLPEVKGDTPPEVKGESGWWWWMIGCDGDHHTAGGGDGGGPVRKSERLKTASKEFFAEEFVGEQWKVMKRPVPPLDFGESSSLKSCGLEVIDLHLRSTFKDCLMNEVEVLKEQLSKKQKENDNFIFAIDLSSGKKSALRKLHESLWSQI